MLSFSILFLVVSNQRVILLLLDQSAAFDTVNYDILVGRFNRLVIRGVILQCLNLYIHSRTQTLKVMDAMFILAETLFRVAPESVLGLLLFICATTK